MKNFEDYIDAADHFKEITGHDHAKGKTIDGIMILDRNAGRPKSRKLKKGFFVGTYQEWTEVIAP